MAKRNQQVMFSHLKYLYKGYRKTVNFSFLLLVLFISDLRAMQPSKYAVQANIIYHFTKYINWPPNKKYGEFMIGIIGESPLYGHLKTIFANKKVGDQKVVLKNNISIKEAGNYHIVFISEDESSNLKRVAFATAGSPVLLLSEEEGLAQRGSCINFVISDQIKLEINKSTIENRRLDIASELLKLGKIVK